MAIVQLNLEQRTASLGGRHLALADKPWQVLAALIAHAPSIVTREQLITDIWAGNHLTGEKGLHQAMWTIRAALHDDARHPTFIRTVQRHGYRWLQATRPSLVENRHYKVWAALATSVTAMAIVAFPGTREHPEQTRYPIPVNCVAELNSGVDAYRLNSDVRIDIGNSCKLVITPSGVKKFGAPIVSDDGSHIAFTVTENQSCFLVTLGLRDGKRTDFSTCSHDVAPTPFFAEGPE